MNELTLEIPCQTNRGSGERHRYEGNRPRAQGLGAKWLVCFATANSCAKLMRNASACARRSVRQPARRNWSTDSSRHRSRDLLEIHDSERGRRMIGKMNAVPEAEGIGVAIVTVEERQKPPGREIER